MQPFKKFLLIEDGSVNTERLKKDLKKRNPEIGIIVYRQGASIPHLLHLEEEQRTVAAIGFMAEEEGETER